jgi:hypothetical protein
MRHIKIIVVLGLIGSALAPAPPAAAQSGR